MNTRRADARGQQARQEDRAEHRTADPGGLHEQEGAGQRRAEQRADRGEAAGGGDHGERLGGDVAPGQPDGRPPRGHRRSRSAVPPGPTTAPTPRLTRAADGDAEQRQGGGRPAPGGEAVQR